MIFTNHRKRTIAQNPTKSHSIAPSPPISAYHSRPPVYMRNSAPVAPHPLPEPVEPAKKPMKWGEPTWFFFHTLAEKIKPDYFNVLKEEVFEIIKLVCSTLPCPNCAQHAKEYMQKIHFQNIRSKEDLQIMLWTFHNEVNKRKGFAIFPIEKLSEKYSTAVTRKIIQFFLYHHEDKRASFRMIADDYYRSQISANLRVWFIKNIHIFEE